MKLGKAGEAYFLERKKHIFLDSRYSRRECGNSYETSPTVTMDDDGSYKSVTASKNDSSFHEKVIDKNVSNTSIILPNQAIVAVTTNSAIVKDELEQQETINNNSRYIYMYIHLSLLIYIFNTIPCHIILYY
jgi:hypothetical protein